jgi:hypothetical protein
MLFVTLAFIRREKKKRKNKKQGLVYVFFAVVVVAFTTLKIKQQNGSNNGLMSIGEFIIRVSFILISTLSNISKDNFLLIH